jgi:hypothetical protein
VNEPEKSAKPVSMSKASKNAPADAPRPGSVVGTVGAMGGSALAAIVAAVSLYGQRDWLQREQVKANGKSFSSAVSNAVAKATSSSADVQQASASASSSASKKWPVSGSGLADQVHQQQTGALIGTIVAVAAISVLAVAVYRGRYWARWGVVGFWALASFTGTMVGIGMVLAIGTSAPPAFKVPAFLAGALLIVAVVLVNLRPSTAYFALSKPVPREGAPARRGMFAPRTPTHADRPGTRGSTGTPSRAKSALTSNAATRGEAYVQKQRSKKRAAANAESVARGAELARSRAKSSKSRRIDT